MGERKKSIQKHYEKTKSLIYRYYFYRQKINPDSLLDGFEIMRKFNLSPSPAIGKLKEMLREAQAEGKVKTRREAFKFLKAKIEDHEKIKVS